jgi:hypothetical protein
VGIQIIVCKFIALSDSTLVIGLRLTSVTLTISLLLFIFSTNVITLHHYYCCSAAAKRLSQCTCMRKIHLQHPSELPGKKMYLHQRSPDKRGFHCTLVPTVLTIL